MTSNPRISAHKQLALKKAVGISNALIKIKSNKVTKKEMISEIRTSLSPWMNNKNFNSYRAKAIDLAIVIYVDDTTIERQDVDNIAKVVLDAISYSKHHDGPFLINNDSQIKRLLVYKMPKTKVPDYITDELVISFREHNPKLQITLTTTSH